MAILSYKYNLSRMDVDQQLSHQTSTALYISPTELPCPPALPALSALPARAGESERSQGVPNRPALGMRRAARSRFDDRDIGILGVSNNDAAPRPRIAQLASLRMDSKDQRIRYRFDASRGLRHAPSPAGYDACVNSTFQDWMETVFPSVTACSSHVVM